MLCGVRSDFVVIPHLGTACLTLLLMVLTTEHSQKPLVATRLTEK